MPKKFWEFRNSADGNAELLLYGDISQHSWWGDEATPREFKADLDAIHADRITVRINSGGGDVFAATTIGNMLEQHSAEVTAQIDGLCASAATIVACHCNRVTAAADSVYMIHPVRVAVMDYADAETLKQYVAAIEAIRDNIVGLYAKKTGRDADEVAALMDATSWWTAAEARDNGFVDELIDEGEDTVIENREGMLFVNAVSMNMPFNAAPKFVQDSQAAAPAAGRFDNTNPVDKKPVNTNPTKEVDGMEIKTIDDLRKAYPELCDQLTEAAVNEAVAAERQRIKDIMDASVSGCEDIANDAMFVNPVSADAFAMAALKNMKTQGATYLDNIKKDAQASGVNAVASVPVTGVKGEEPDEFMNAIREQNKR